MSLRISLPGGLCSLSIDGAPGRGGVKVCYYTPLTWGEKDLLSLAISSENEAFILKTPCV